MSDRIDGGEAISLELRSREMDEAMKGYRRHQVDEETSGSATLLAGNDVSYLVTLSRE